MDGISLITPTSDRPAAFRLCERWMRGALERLPGVDVEWIVADDGRVPVECTLGQRHLRLPPASRPAASFRRNLQAALQQAARSKIVFIEDDDWYAPNYLVRMSEWLDGPARIVGEARAKYYNIRTRRYLRCHNRAHASLCQTGIARSLVPHLIGLLRRRSTAFVDIELWRWSAAARIPRLLWPNTQHSVGIKGLPGKQGIGIGHRLDRHCAVDDEGRVLRHWLGNDATIYENVCHDA